jgi:hypothetical protein
MLLLNDDIRVLTPMEKFKITQQIYDVPAYIKFRYVDSSGLRGSEYNYILDNPNEIDYDKRVIHFKDHQWDKARRYRDRDVYFSTFDMYNIILFTKLRERMNTESYQLNRNLKAWALKANISPLHMDSQTIRNTRMAWLMTLFPSLESKIVSSMDYYGDVNIFKNIPFSKTDKLSMTWVLGDWGGSSTY